MNDHYARIIVMDSRKPIYDPEDLRLTPEERGFEFVSTPLEGPLYETVATCRKATVGALSHVKRYFDKANNAAQIANRVRKNVFANIPAEERSPVGLGVIAVAAMSGTLMLPHRPFVRTVFVIPALTLGSAAFAYPQTSKYIVKTGLAHSGGPTHVDELPSMSDVPSLIAHIPEQFKRLPSLDEISTKLAASFNTSSPAPSSVPAQATAAVEDAADVVETATDKLSDKIEDTVNADALEDVKAVAEDVSESVSATADVIVAPSESAEETEGDLGQARQEDVDTYIQRR